MFIVKAFRNFVKRTAAQAAFVIITLMAPLAFGVTILPAHFTDGGFNLHNGGSQTSDAPEWSGPNVVKRFFPFIPSNGSGGAYLYVEQSGSTLFLMYDYVNGNSSATPFFDVFFQDPPENTDYGVRISGNTISAFEKPFGPPSSLNPDGSFNFSGPPWTPLDAADLALANFHGAVGFGASPNSLSAHLMAEFDLTINKGGTTNPTGIYDPAPAFWSATCTRCSGSSAAALDDPPISSAIFQLNPDGSTTVTPVLGPGGGPIQQPVETAATPEPASLWLAAPFLGLFLVQYRLTRAGLRGR